MSSRHGSWRTRIEGALNVAEFTWSQTEFLRFFYGYGERSIVAARLAIACGRTDFARTVADSRKKATTQITTQSATLRSGTASGTGR